MALEQVVKNFGTVELVNVAEEIIVRIIDDNSPTDASNLGESLPICVVHGTQDIAYSSEYIKGYFKILGRTEDELEYHDVVGASNFMAITDPDE